MESLKQGQRKTAVILEGPHNYAKLKTGIGVCSFLPQKVTQHF